MVRDWIRRFFRWQVKICRFVDAALLPRFSIDGNESFMLRAQELVRVGFQVADVGGGKTPFFSPEDVERSRLRVIGVDISSDELSRAPEGAYAEFRIGPIEELRGDRDCNLVVAQSVLEHVSDGKKAAEGIASFCGAGGIVITFCPNRRAWFAQLNILLPERVKRWLLFSIFPEKRFRQGFPAFYDGCTPAEFVENFGRCGIETVEIVPYFTSSYFMFFVPFYAVWRVLTFPFMKLWPMKFCETFVFVGRRR